MWRWGRGEREGGGLKGQHGGPRGGGTVLCLVCGGGTTHRMKTRTHARRHTHAYTHTHIYTHVKWKI